MGGSQVLNSQPSRRGVAGSQVLNRLNQSHSPSSLSLLYFADLPCFSHCDIDITTKTRSAENKKNAAHTKGPPRMYV